MFSSLSEETSWLELPKRIPKVKGKDDCETLRWVAIVGGTDLTLTLMNDETAVTSFVEKGAGGLNQDISKISGRLLVMASEILDRVAFAVELQDRLCIEVRVDRIERGQCAVGWPK